MKPRPMSDVASGSITSIPNLAASLADVGVEYERTTQEGRGFQFPSALTVLALVTILVWALSFVVPAGRYELNADGAPIAGTYTRIPAVEGLGERVRDLFLAPANGLYGVRDARSGQVEPSNSGDLYGSAGVFLFVLAVGAFITTMLATGSLERAVGRLAHAMRKRGWLLIVVIMSLFSLLGTVEGFAEETLGFYGLVIPLMLALGYDRMVAVGAIILGAGVGVTAGTVNPFAVGVASSAADVALGEGIVPRVLMWLILTSVTIAYVLRYANKVHRSPQKSIVGFAPGDRDEARRVAAAAPKPLTFRHLFVLGVVGLTFGLMIFSVIPWAEVMSGPDAQPFSWELNWSFSELAALFVVAAIVVGIVGGLRERRLNAAIAKGAGDFLYPALVIVLARGVTVIMNNSHITETVLHWMENAISGTSSGLFAVLIFIVNLPLAFLIPSTSGHATLVMPILAPLGDFAHVPRPVVVSAWDAASGWMNLVTPTTATVMGGIAIAKVGYNQYLRFVLPLLGILFVVISAALFVEASILSALTG
jgi:uncharacterized ion transporter superfamily protein YfcC